MHWLDWLVLLGGLGFIVVYGVWKTRNTDTAKAYLRGRANQPMGHHRPKPGR